MTTYCGKCWNRGSNWAVGEGRIIPSEICSSFPVKWSFKLYLKGIIQPNLGFVANNKITMQPNYHFHTTSWKDCKCSLQILLQPTRVTMFQYTNEDTGVQGLRGSGCTTREAGLEFRFVSLQTPYRDPDCSQRPFFAPFYLFILLLPTSMYLYLFRVWVWELSLEVQQKYQIVARNFG